MTEVRVFDWPGTFRWYVETLGLRLLLHDEPNGFVLLGAGNGRLALRRSTAVCEAINHARLVFRVADVDAERARLLRSGIPVTEPVVNARESYREVRLSDPEGTSITLFTWTRPVPYVRAVRSNLVFRLFNTDHEGLPRPDESPDAGDC